MLILPVRYYDLECDSFLSSAILHQAVIMLFLILVGMGCFKTGIITENGSKELSRLVLTIVNPVVIFMAYQTDFRPELVKGFISSLILSVVAYIISMAISYMLIRRKNNSETDIERFSCIYSNCAFMGIPLIQSILGYEGVFYLTAFLTVFNILVWTHGVIQISGVKNMKSVVKAFKSPSLIAVAAGLACFLLRLRLPEILSDTLGFISAVNTPLAMLVAGATIARTNIISALKNKRIYYVTFITLLVIPLLTCIVFRLIPLGTAPELSVLVAASAPAATMCTMFSLNYGRNSLYASEIFAVTTLLSALTMPLAVYLYNF